MRRLGVAIGMAFLSSSCSGNGWHDVPIVSVSTVSASPLSLSVELFAVCDAHTRVSVVEQATQVRLTGQAQGGSNVKCAKVETVDLSYRVSSRTILDAVSGESFVCNGAPPGQACRPQLAIARPSGPQGAQLQQ